MVDLKSITKDAIVKYILSCESTIDPSNWYVGITGQDPNERKKQHESEKNIICQYFKYWDVYKEYIAKEIEDEIADLGVSKFTKDLNPIITASNKDSSGSEEKHYVYVYLAVENARAKDK